MGKTFISWFKLIYASQVGSIITNNDKSTMFSLHRSVQQGGPLSPALFAVALELHKESSQRCGSGLGRHQNTHFASL